MDKEFNFSEWLREFYHQRDIQELIRRTGIDSYCNCCGAPHYVGKELEHDKECVWYKPN